MDDVIAIAALDRIDAEVAVDEIITGSAEDSVNRNHLSNAAVFRTSGVENVVAGTAKDGVAACIAEDDVAVSALQVGSEVANQDVRTQTAEQRVAASFAI